MIFEILATNVQGPLQEQENVEGSVPKKKNKKKKKNKQKVASEKCAIDGYLSFTFFHRVILLSFAKLVPTSVVLQIVEDNGVKKPKKKKLKL